MRQPPSSLKSIVTLLALLSPLAGPAAAAPLTETGPAAAAPLTETGTEAGVPSGPGGGGDLSRLSGSSCISLQKCGCTSVAMSTPNWTVTDLLYSARYPHAQDQGGSPYAFITFNVTNPAVGRSSHCAASSMKAEDFFYGEQWYPCDYDEAGGGEKAPARALFRYDRPSGKLDINQTWVCDDQGYPANFRVSGGTTMSLQCNDTAKETGPGRRQTADEAAEEAEFRRVISCDEVTVNVPWADVEAWA